MNPCPHCQTPNIAESKFCRSCGKPVEVPSTEGHAADSTVRWTGRAPPGEAPEASATVRWSGQKLPTPTVGPRRSMVIDSLFASKARVVIGRAPDCDVCLPHPTVSRYHALLERGPDDLRLRDLAA
jgi:hypothetical protein